MVQGKWLRALMVFCFLGFSTQVLAGEYCVTHVIEGEGQASSWRPWGDEVYYRLSFLYWPQVCLSSINIELGIEDEYRIPGVKHGPSLFVQANLGAGFLRFYGSLGVGWIDKHELGKYIRPYFELKGPEITLLGIYLNLFRARYYFFDEVYRPMFKLGVRIGWPLGD